MNQWRKIGKVKDAHGIKGELYILVFSKDTSWLGELKSLKLSSVEASAFKVLEVSRAKAHKGGFILKTPHIHDRNQAEALKGWLVEVPEELFVSEPGEGIYLSEIEGFKIQDQTQGELGEITGFSSNGAQDLLVVKTTQGVLFEIPFVEAFILEIRWQEKSILTDLPEGLIESQVGGE